MFRLSFTALLLLVPMASAEPLRFFGCHAEAYQCDAVVFTYRDDNSDFNEIHLSQITGCHGDFNTDGIWDEEMTVGDSDPETGLAITTQKINTAWSATRDHALSKMTIGNPPHLLGTA